MKVVYVGDNRNRGNLGCRATSTALSQLISHNHDIVGTITGKYNMWNFGDLFYIDWLPAWSYSFLSKIPKWTSIRRLWYKLIKRSGRDLRYSTFDFVRDDPKKTRKNFLKAIVANDTIKEFDLRQYDFDALVINGEGSFIFSTPPWREALIITMLMDWAGEMGKKVFFLNAMLSDDPNSKHNDNTIKEVTPVFKSCSVVAVRENYSASYCKTYFSEVSYKIIPDALFTWYDYVNDGFNVPNGRYFIPHQLECDKYYYIFDFEKPYILIAGSSSDKIGNNRSEAIERYSNLVTATKNRFGIRVYLIQTCEGDSFLKEVSIKTNTSLIPMEFPILAIAKILANARVFISGRYHPSILASLGGTPCLLMGSNSHKTISLQYLLEYDNPIEFNVLPDKDDCNAILNLAEEKLSSGNELREKIKSRCKYLSNTAKEQNMKLLAVDS